MKKISYIIGLFILISIITFLFFRPFRIIRSSVADGKYKEGQIVLVERFSYFFKDPKINDVVVFKNIKTKRIGRIYNIKKEDTVVIYSAMSDAGEYFELTQDKIIARVYWGLPFKEKPYAVFESSSIIGFKKYRNQVYNYEIDLPESWVAWPFGRSSATERIRAFANKEPDDNYMAGYNPETISLTISFFGRESDSEPPCCVFDDPVGTVDDGEKRKITKLADLNINGLEAIKEFTEGKSYQKYYEITFTIKKDENSGYVLRFFSPIKETLDGEVKLLDQIVNSFKVSN